MKPLRVALVHDWFTGMRGGEKCLEVLCEIFPDAPIYTLLHVKGAMSPLIESKKIHTSFVQRFPNLEKKYRSYLPLFPRAIESFDFSGYDVVISSSHCAAKGAIVPSGTLHICYCHTPMRYVWDMYDEYFGKGRAGIVTRAAMSIIAPYLRRWDVRTAKRVNFFIANSDNVRKRIQRIYRRDADVIFPPVDTEQFHISQTKSDQLLAEKKDGGYHLIVSALVPYKRVDLAIKVFNENGKRLLIVGKGPDEEKLRAMSKPNIEFLGWRDDHELAELYAGSTALLFPGEEDFGIVPLEAMACGKPVIAYGKGGALETVVEGVTGTFFYEQTREALASAVERASSTFFNHETIRAHALKFSRAVYKNRMEKFIREKIRLLNH